MLKNPTPDTPTNIPDTDIYRKFEYVLLVPSSSRVGSVSIAALLYKSAADFHMNNMVGDCWVGTIDFDINQAGLLEACEDYALTKFTGLEKCAVPTQPEENND